jgi:hypothetical protein
VRHAACPLHSEGRRSPRLPSQRALVADADLTSVSIADGRDFTEGESHFDLGETVALTMKRGTGPAESVACVERLGWKIAFRNTQPHRREALASSPPDDPGNEPMTDARSPRLGCDPHGNEACKGRFIRVGNAGRQAGDVAVCILVDEVALSERRRDRQFSGVNDSSRS